MATTLVKDGRHGLRICAELWRFESDPLPPPVCDRVTGLSPDRGIVPTDGFEKLGAIGLAILQCLESKCPDAAGNRLQITVYISLGLMRAALFITLVTIALLKYAGAQTVVSDGRLPPDSIELKRNDPPATSPPWQLPKPGDPLFDSAKEAQIKRENERKDKAVTHHLVRTYERGVFKAYDTLQWGEPAKKMDDPFTPNPKLPPDAVELSSAARPAKSDYFPTRSQRRPWNIPDDYIAVRVFHRGKVIGWTFMPKEAVVMLHKKT